jgi:dipeptidase E
MSDLFLAGGGGPADSRELDQLFVKTLGVAGGIAYVPVAMESPRYPDSLSWMESVFLPLGVRRIVMWTSLEHKTVEDLQDAGGLYIGGGDTVKLLREVCSSGFAEVLHAFVEQGGPVYGGSAGAILLGCSIKTAPEARSLEFESARGLDLLHGYSVVCHYDAAAREPVLAFVGDTGRPVVALSERAGLHVRSDGRATSLGYEPVFLAGPRVVEEIAPQKAVNLAALR